MPSWASCSLLGWNCLGTSQCREWPELGRMQREPRWRRKLERLIDLEQASSKGTRGSRRHVSLGSLGEAPGRDQSACHEQQHLRSCIAVSAHDSFTIPDFSKAETESLSLTVSPDFRARRWIWTHLTFANLNEIEGDWWNMFRARERERHLGARDKLTTWRNFKQYR